MPKVSIIIPVYNTEKYLDKCIQTLTNQTLQDIEIIFVDDGSTDNSLEIINFYAEKDNRIIVLTQNHKKQGAARNYGIKIAKGEYIGFVDSDDWVQSDMFEKLYNTALKNDTDITMCSSATFDENKQEFIPYTYNTLDVFKESFLDRTFTPDETYGFLFNISVSPCNKIFKRNFLENKQLYFPENIYYEDNIFFYNCWLKAHRINLLNESLYIYRKFSTTSTCSGNDKNKLDVFKMLDATKPILIKNNVYTILKSNFYRHKYHTLKNWYNNITDKKIKTIFYIKMLFNMPTAALSSIINRDELILYFKLYMNKREKIIFWGASNFLKQFLKKHKIKNKNILGIVDRNKDVQGSMIENLKIFAPEDINKLKPDKIIITIINYNLESKKYIEEFLAKNYKEHCLLELL